MLKKYFSKEELKYWISSDDILSKTLELVLRVFDNKLDKGGKPNLLHIFKIYIKVKTQEEKIVALLHDIIENTDITEEDLKEYGYSSELINTLLCLTKKKGEYYPDYIDRIINSNNLVALSVKLEDLKSNIDIKDLDNPSISDYERINNRYLPAYHKIQNKLEEIQKEGE